MKIKIARIVYAAYIKSSRFIAYFENADVAMKYLAELYPTEEKHVEPMLILEEETVMK